MRDHPRVLKFLSSFPNIPLQEIEEIDKIFNRVKKPYLQKRDNLQAFLGRKRGSLVKPAPDAYGLSGSPHYYFIHSYNCLYECQYCYLQGYFNSPDLVFFLNHEEIGDKIKEVCDSHPEQEEVWFHAGEFSDSLALSHLTGELPYYFSLFQTLPKARLELRTKSANIKELKSLSPQKNITVSFSLSTADQVKTFDLKTPPLKTRLKAMRELQDLGHPIGIHIDPVIYEDDFEEKFAVLFDEMKNQLDLSAVHYVSLGVVRFTKDVYHQVQKNYPDSPLHGADWVKSFDQKVRYSRPLRNWMLGKIKSLGLAAGFNEEQIYLCMESMESTEN